MKWSNVRLILAREIRDQLRDRRTLFMIGVLPLLLYPLLGMSFFQFTQFMREHATRVLVVGAPVNSDLPPLVENDRFAASLFAEAKNAALLHVTLQPSHAPAAGRPWEELEQARRDMLEGKFDMVVYFPASFAAEFTRFHKALLQSRDGGEPAGVGDSRIPSVEIYPNLANDASLAGHRRVSDVLNRWREAIGRQNLKDSRIPAIAAKPFEIATHDVADAGQHKAAAWSKILPFVLLICALTGAFYPAVDLCAGEKERGTLETLLSSPAERIEIVWGKLLT
ncbi:MAG TPA: ABC transporter permease subunit, partial [Anaerolineae bacterium]|nr:ABC transporter permease subunit [Anaerolineae bacterium]